jgi:hypothetical protein
MQDRIGITVVRAAQSMAFFAFIFTASFALFNSVISDYQGFLKRPWLRSIVKVSAFAALFLLIMKSSWFHNWISDIVLRSLTTENYPPPAELEVRSEPALTGGPSSWTYLFYLFVLVLAAAPIWFVRLYWREARIHAWDWISQDSRNMYVDGAKTLITASGIAVALLASSAASSVRSANALMATSARIAAVSLISCVCVSLIAILALLRGFERAQSRFIDEQRKEGNRTTAGQGKLTGTELVLILVPTSVALSCFLVGFAFLGRIAFHF